MSTFWAVILTLYLMPSVALLVVVIFRAIEELFIHIMREADEQ